MISVYYQSHSQTNDQQGFDAIGFITFHETSPQWTEGTLKDLQTDIFSKLNYAEMGGCIEGITILSLTIDTLGNVVDPKIMRSLSKNLDEQLLAEIVKHKFIPGKFGDHKVPIRLNIPFRIRLE